MTDQHPITLPPELVQTWVDDWYKAKVKHDELIAFIATQAARWGADQELEACCEWLVANDWKAVHKHLRAARRPKPPSLKEQALQALDLLKADATTHGLGFDSSTIRRAIESLPD